MRSRVKQQTVQNEIITADPKEIIRLHTTIVQRFSVHIRYPVVIGTSRDSPDGWKRSAITNDPVRFSMWDKPGDFGQIKAPKNGDRSETPVLCLEEAEIGEVPWVAWYEEWIPSQRNKGEFEFKTASLTFFWGRSSGRLDQLFRAEWVEPEHGSDNAATPHWHIDWELAEVGMLMSGIHLGMAGWEASGSGVKCWQRGVYGKWNDIVVWADRTLYYAKNQLKLFPLA